MTLTLKDVELFYSRLAQENPAPKGELHYTNDYTLLVAVVLSAQSTDAGVNRATQKLFKIAPTPQKMIDLGEAGLVNHIKTIGLFRNKAKNVIALSQRLVEKYNGNIPNTRDELVTLPGVGRKTANVVLNIAFRQPTMAVDTHIFRIANRTGLAPGKDVDQVETRLIRRTPDKFKLDAHHWLILFGRYVCKARNPLCEACINLDICQYKEKNL
jgi:endonuclease-3